MGLLGIDAKIKKIVDEQKLAEEIFKQLRVWLEENQATPAELKTWLSMRKVTIIIEDR